MVAHPRGSWHTLVEDCPETGSSLGSIFPQYHSLASRSLATRPPLAHLLDSIGRLHSFVSFQALAGCNMQVALSDHAVRRDQCKLVPMISSM